MNDKPSPSSPSSPSSSGSSHDSSSHTSGNSGAELPSAGAQAAGPGDGFHMSSKEFRRWGHAVIDWIADYQDRVASLPVLSRSRPGELRDQLPSSPPEHGDDFSAILSDLDRLIMPGVTHWQSPNFFAYFPANISGPSILGELLSAGLGVQGMLWTTSPACTELESHMLDWLVEMLGLPETFTSSSDGGGVIQDSASSSTLCALLAARERASQQQYNAEGCDRRLTVYTSTQAHSSVVKAVKIAGIGEQNLRLIEVDERFAMRPEKLAEAIETDRRNGKIPGFVCATVGTTSSLAIDPIAAIGEVCRKHQVWLHVDAAMAGTAALCPEVRFIHEGVELADSYSFNPHKWMFTNFDCNAFYVADRGALIRALSILPEYLRNQASESGAVIDYRDWQLPLGRRFRALKLWLVIRHYGIEGLRHHIRQHIALTRTLTGWIRDDDDFELVAPALLNLVCFRHRGGDETTRAIMDRLNASGALFLTHTKLNDAFTLRLCIGQTHTRAEHVERAWKLIRETAAELEAR